MRATTSDPHHCESFSEPLPWCSEVVSSDESLEKKKSTLGWIRPDLFSLKTRQADGRDWHVFYKDRAAQPVRSFRWKPPSLHRKINCKGTSGQSEACWEAVMRHPQNLDQWWSPRVVLTGPQNGFGLGTTTSSCDQAAFPVMGKLFWAPVVPSIGEGWCPSTRMN